MVLGKKIRNMDKTQLKIVCLEKLTPDMLVEWANNYLETLTKADLIDEIKTHSNMTEESEVVI